MSPHPDSNDFDSNPITDSLPMQRPGTAQARQSGMSYKFQRLREKLREAIASGEFAGKLPGERALAKRFHVNAKTLSKALTDLAAEGLLDRSIGRGTYVKGTAPAQPVEGRWLLLAGPDERDSCLLGHLRQHNPHVEVATDLASLRPSFLNQFSAVIDAANNTPESLLRDLVVRNLPVVAIGHEPRTYSVHAVLMDQALGVSQISRDLFLSGHRRVAAVETNGSMLVTHAAKQAAQRYARDASVEVCSPDDVAAMLGDGPIAIICDSISSARKVKALLDRTATSTASEVSLAAVGSACGEHPCSGYYTDCRKLVESAVRLLRETPARPTTLWMAGEFVDRGTLTAPMGGDLHEAPALQGHGVLV